MPLYDYACANCGNTVEVMHGVHGHGPSECTVCGGPMKKQFAAPAVHYRGTGWARKDRSAGHAKKSSSPAKDASSSPATDGSSSPAKDSSTDSAARKDGD